MSKNDKALVSTAVNQFKKIWRTRDFEAEQNEAIKPKDRVMYMDNSNVMAMIPKRTWFKNQLESVFDVGQGRKVPDWVPLGSNGSKIEEGLPKSKYSSEWLQWVLAFCKHYESVTFTMGTDYPLQIETDDFIWILAPRIDND